MRLFGLDITLARARAAPNGVAKAAPPSLSAAGYGWFPIVREARTGAWQRGEEMRVETGMQHPTLFRCVSLISSDIAKMRLCLQQQDADGVWTEASSPAFSPVLAKPNGYQTRIQFIEAWIMSKLTRGNTYVLKERDNRGVVVRLHVLDPLRTRPLVAPDGSVWYELNTDYLANVETPEAVPASEIIHDRWNCLFHPLIGLSPIYACGLPALQGLEIQRNAIAFFRNASLPGGMLTAPAHIDQETADRIKKDWADNYSGENAGKLAVAGDGLQYVPMGVSPDDALLVEQLKWSAETVCSVMGVPAYMAGVGAAPLNNNVQALQVQYYTQALQILIESAELLLVEGLGLDEPKVGKVYGVCFDLDGLLRMDTASLITSLAEGVKGSIYKPDEARAKLNLGKVPGGNSVYAQQQNYSLAALAKRDAKADPFDTAKPADASAPMPAANDDAATEAQAAKALLEVYRGLA